MYRFGQISKNTWKLWNYKTKNGCWFPTFDISQFSTWWKYDKIYTFPTRAPAHYIFTMYQTPDSLGMLFLIQAKSGFHYHMRLAIHEIMVFGCIKNRIPGFVVFDTTSDTLVSNATCPGSFVFVARTKFKLFYGCPRPFQSPTREASRPTQRGGLEGGAPPVRKQFEFCMAVQEVPGKGNHAIEFIVFGCIRNNIPREFWFWYNLRHPCIKCNISRNFCFCCNKKVQTFLWLSKALPVTN